MIEPLKDFLIHQKLASSKQRIDFECRLVGNWSVLCYLDDELTYFIKRQTHSSLTDEYNLLHELYDLLDDLVFKPMVWMDEAFQGYVQMASAHRFFSLDNFLTSNVIRAHLRDFFKAQLQGLLPQRSHSPVVSTHISQESLNLPRISQHGDLTPTNVLMTKSGTRLIDWEDYGLCDFPLMDLTILLYSLVEFDHEKWRQLISQAQIKAWLCDILKELEVSIAQFIRLAPISLSYFYQLKKVRNYGPEVQARVLSAFEKAKSTMSESMDA